MKYLLQERIGVGGMGEVFRTADGFAVKRLLPHLASDARFLDLFLAEVRVCAQLQHPNIVRIIDFGEVGGSWALVMELVDGVDLREVPKLPPGCVAQLGASAASALHHAHTARDRHGRALKVLHRDVSPHNVLVSRHGEVKLIDFGIARATEGLPGKWAYLSPEVAEGGEATPRSDQFSLGVLLWERLTGKRLFKGVSDAVTLQKVVACEVPLPKVAKGLDDVVMRALAKAPDERWPDCGAFCRALDDARMEFTGGGGADELVAAVFV